MGIQWRSLFIYIGVAILLQTDICLAKAKVPKASAQTLAQQTGATHFEEHFEEIPDEDSSSHKLKKRESDEDFDYEVYQGVVGRPGIDFPVLPRIPQTSFSCRAYGNGYFADLETECQVFHICDGGRKISFLCPNGTIFQQTELTCDWWFKVNCAASPGHYVESTEMLSKAQRNKSQWKRPYHKRIENDFPSDEYVRNDHKTSGHKNQYPVKDTRLYESDDRLNQAKKYDTRLGSDEAHSGENFDFEDISDTLQQQHDIKNEKITKKVETDEPEMQLVAESASFLDGNKRNQGHRFDNVNQVKNRGGNDDDIDGFRGQKPKFERGNQKFDGGSSKAPRTGNNVHSGGRHSGRTGKYDFNDNPDSVILSPGVPFQKPASRTQTPSPRKFGPYPADDTGLPHIRRDKVERPLPRDRSVTYTTARRVDTTKTTPFYTPTVPTVANRNNDFKITTVESTKMYFGQSTTLAPILSRYQITGSNNDFVSNTEKDSYDGPKRVATQSRFDLDENDEHTTEEPNYPKGFPTHLSKAIRNQVYQDGKFDQTTYSAATHFPTTTTPFTGPTYIPTTTSNPSSSSSGPTYIPTTPSNVFSFGTTTFAPRYTTTTDNPSSSGPTYLPRSTTDHVSSGGPTYLPRSTTEAISSRFSTEYPSSSRPTYVPRSTTEASSSRFSTEYPSSSRPTYLPRSTTEASSSRFSTEYTSSSRPTYLPRSTTDAISSRFSTEYPSSSGPTYLPRSTTESSSTSAPTYLPTTERSSHTGPTYLPTTTQFTGPTYIPTTTHNPLTFDSQTTATTAFSGPTYIPTSTHAPTYLPKSTHAPTYLPTTATPFTGPTYIPTSATSTSAPTYLPKSSSTGPTYLPRSTTTTPIEDETDATTDKGDITKHVKEMLNTLKRLNIDTSSIDTDSEKFINGIRNSLESGPESIQNLASFFSGTDGSVSLTTQSAETTPSTGDVNLDIAAGLLSNKTIEKYEKIFGLGSPETTSEPVTVAFQSKSGIASETNDLESQQTSDPIRDAAGKPETRKIAQVFTNALSAYLQDPESFRKILSEIRPTEPPTTEYNRVSNDSKKESTTKIPTTTTEDLEVLDFSDHTGSGGHAETTTPASTIRVTTFASTADRTPASRFLTETLEKEAAKFLQESSATTTTESNLAVEINKGFDLSTIIPYRGTDEEKKKTTLQAKPTTLSPLAFDLLPPSFDDDEDTLQRAQSQSFVTAGNRLLSGKTKSPEKTLKSQKITSDAPLLSTPRSGHYITRIGTAKQISTTESPDTSKYSLNLSPITDTTFIDPLTINDELMKNKASTTTPSAFTYIPRQTTTTAIPTTRKLTTVEGAPLRFNLGEIPSGAFTIDESTKQSTDRVGKDFLDISEEIILPRNGMQKIANQIFGALNETSAEHLMNVMKKAEDNRTVRKLILLLIQTCDDDYSKTVEQSRQALLNALIGMDDDEDQDNVKIIRVLPNRRSKSINSPRFGVNTLSEQTTTTTTTDSPVSTTEASFTSTTVASSGEWTTQTDEGTTRFEIRVEDSDEQESSTTEAAESLNSSQEVATTTYRTTTTTTTESVPSFDVLEPQARTSSRKIKDVESSLGLGTDFNHKSSDQRALELLKSLYSLASKFGRR